MPPHHPYYFTLYYGINQQHLIKEIIVRKKAKWSLFAEQMIVYIKKPREPIQKI